MPSFTSYSARFTLAFSALAAAQVLGPSCTESADPAATESDAGPVDAQMPGDRSEPMRDAVVEDVPPIVEAGAAPSPVRVGVTPVPVYAAGFEPTVSDELAAHLQGLSAGARAVTLSERWDVLQDETGEFTARWEELDRIVDLYPEGSTAFLFSLRVVEGRQDARPEFAQDGWEQRETIMRIEDVVNEVLARYGDKLFYFSLGFQIDAYLSAVQGTERTQFLSFARHVLDYVSAHNQRPDAMRAGVSLSLAALVESLGDEASELQGLLEASDVLMLTHLALDVDFSAAAPERLSAALTELLSMSSGDDGNGKDLVLEQVGYPSSELAGATQEQQASFYDNLFSTLRERRERIPFVSVYALNDLSQERCESEASFYSESPNESLQSALCSMGLRQRVDDGSDDAAEPRFVRRDEPPQTAPKPAWANVLKALSNFSEP